MWCFPLAIIGVTAFPANKSVAPLLFGEESEALVLFREAVREFRKIKYAE
jgi:hypothetical protein